MPFYGVVYTDGHPWDVREVEGLLGEAAFASLKERVFEVEYFDGEFKTSRKKSITPRIDFDLGDDLGTGSPDASAGVGKDNFSIRWNGRLVPAATGSYTLFGDCDGVLCLWVDGALVFEKSDNERREARGQVQLEAGRRHQVRVDYTHRDGAASNHVYWSGPGFEKNVLLLNRE